MSEGQPILCYSIGLTTPFVVRKATVRNAVCRNCSAVRIAPALTLHLSASGSVFDETHNNLACLMCQQINHEQRTIELMIYTGLSDNHYSH